MSVETPDRLIKLALDAIPMAAGWDLGKLLDRQPDRSEVTNWPGEHYRLLPALARSWGATRVVEIGTYRGASALALATEQSIASVETFDLIAWQDFHPTYLRADDFPRITQRLGNLAEPAVFAAYESIINDAEMIFIDAPKDGVFEQKLVEQLLRSSPRSDQLLVFDDIRVLTMVELWRSLTLEKLDLTSFGHWSGTGLAIRPAQRG